MERNSQATTTNNSKPNVWFDSRYFVFLFVSMERRSEKKVILFLTLVYFIAVVDVDFVSFVYSVMSWMLLLACLPDCCYYYYCLPACCCCWWLCCMFCVTCSLSFYAIVMGIRCTNIHQCSHTQLSSISYADSSSSFPFIRPATNAIFRTQHIILHLYACACACVWVWVYVLIYSRIRSLNMLADFWTQHIQTEARVWDWICACIEFFSTTYTRKEALRSYETTNLNTTKHSTYSPCVSIHTDMDCLCCVSVYSTLGPMYAFSLSHSLLVSVYDLKLNESERRRRR